MGHAATSRVVDAGWLRPRLADPDVVVVEVTYTPVTEADATVIAGARRVYWKDLLWHPSRREFPSARVLAGRLHALGARAASTVVFAGDPPQFAAYALWVAAAVGLGGDLRYLDGGLPAWQPRDASAPPPSAAEPISPGRPHRSAESALSEGRVTSAAAGSRPAADAQVPTGPTFGEIRFRTDTSVPSVEELLPHGPSRHADLVVGRDEVRAALGTSTVLLDLRSPEEYSGARVSPSSEPIDHGAERAGHIPGALSLPVHDLLDDNGLLRPVPEIRARIAALGIDEAERIIAYCRLSHRASLGWLVFTELLGDHRVRVYDGSWTEWGSLVGAPVES